MASASWMHFRSAALLFPRWHLTWSKRFQLLPGGQPLLGRGAQIRLRELRRPGHHGRLQGHLLLQHRLPVDRRHRAPPRHLHLQDGHQPGVQGKSVSWDSGGDEKEGDRCHGNGGTTPLPGDRWGRGVRSPNRISSAIGIETWSVVGGLYGKENLCPQSLKTC